VPKVKIGSSGAVPYAQQRMQDPEFRAAYIRMILDEIASDSEFGASASIASWIAKHQPFQSRTGSATSSWRASIESDSSVRITSRMPYTYWLNHGVRPHQMVYLLNVPWRTYYAFGHVYQARCPIPLPVIKGAWTKAQGKGQAGMTIFRRPTEKSMAEGKWRHPGYTGKHFLEQALTEYVQAVMKRHPELIIDFDMG
jgi:hypothetical protein